MGRPALYRILRLALTMRGRSHAAVGVRHRVPSPFHSHGWSIPKRNVLIALAEKLWEIHIRSNGGRGVVGAQVIVVICLWW